MRNTAGSGRGRLRDFALRALGFARRAGPLVVALGLLAIAPRPAPDDVAHTTDPLPGLERQLAAREYRASQNAQGLQAPNRAHNLRTYFERDGVRVHDRTAAGGPELLALRLVALGRGEQRAPVPAGEPRAAGARVEIPRGDVLEWYENSPAGLEQGFDLAARPAGTGELWLELELSGARARRRGDALELETATGRRLRYAKLAARDATGAELPARMELHAASLRLVVADAGAAYPLQIDPLLTDSADALVEADQDGAQLGVSVAGAGDVNGDGYADVIAGANLYDAGVVDEGAAFVFLGSATGLPSGDTDLADALLHSAQGGSLFGRSVASAGDVNGDGYGDVIVGARLYTLGQGDEGAAFIWHGGPAGIAGGDPSTANTTLEGEQATAEFGMAVAGAGDVNGDGFGDVIVGAWSYSATPSNEGAAFVFHGSPAGVAPGTAASAPTQLESDQSGSLFGAAVAAAGDVNGDGYGDVIVGARHFGNPLDDEGGAFVFLGSASGVADATVAFANAHIEGEQAGANLGWSVAGAGDVNGDGYGDVIVGALGWGGGGGQVDEGAALVVLGGLLGIPDANPSTNCWLIQSDQPNAQLGSGVGGAGDVNGDGYGDVIVGARSWTGDETDEGAMFVFLGGAAGLPVLPSGDPTTAHTQLEGDDPNSQFGSDVAGAGDVNGDGFSDVIAGAPTFDGDFTDSGAVFFARGGNEGIVDGSPESAASVVSSGQSGADLGAALASAGDVNGDGYGDVIIGAPQYDGGVADAGAAFVLHGGPNGIAGGVPADAATLLESTVADSRFGDGVSSAGDVNGDGYGDVIVGASRYTDGGTNEGAAFIFLGSATGVADTTSATAATRLEGNQGGVYFGSSLGSAGDVNGDGYGDVIVGAFQYAVSPGVFSGAAFVFHGSAGGIPSGNADTATTVLDGQISSLQFGSSVAGAGDVNGDGFSDVVVGAGEYTNPEFWEGAVFVYYGSAAGIPDGNMTTANARIEGNEVGARLSRCAGAGDVNGDGYGDVVAFTTEFDIGAMALVFHGGPAGIGNGSAETADGILDSIGLQQGFGWSLASAGDVDADGYGDVIVGAISADSSNGAAYVFRGGPGGVGFRHASTADAAIVSAQHRQLGMDVAGAGDVNGDGFADVLVGSNDTTSLDAEAFVFLGNGNHHGRPVRPQQLRASPDSAFVGPLGSAGHTDEFRTRLVRTSPFGRVRTRVEVETCPNGRAFGAFDCVRTLSGSWSDLGLNPGGSTLTLTVPGLAGGRLHQWRARALYAPRTTTVGGSVAPPNPAHGPWRRVNGAVAPGDVRTLADADEDEVTDSLDNCPVTPNAGQEDVDTDLAGDACDNCVNAANPRPSALWLSLNSWVTRTGGQRDDDHDGYGNRCDGDFPGTTGGNVGPADLAQFRASNGESRTGDTCGTLNTRPCAIFDLDENTTGANNIGPGDLARFRALQGSPPGPRCPTCPLACLPGSTGSCF